MVFVHLFRLLRPVNLMAMILLLAILFYYSVPPNLFWTTGNIRDVAMCIISVISIAGAGNLLNDKYDLDIDAVNHPQKKSLVVGITSLLKAYLWLNAIGIIAALFVTVDFVILVIMVIAVLYLYSAFLKRTFLLGNIVVALLTALLLFVPYYAGKSQIFDIKNILAYAFFAFTISLIRELVKDIVDIEGDQIGSCKTMPIVLGIAKCNNWLLFFLSVLIISIVIFMVGETLFLNTILIIAVLIPLALVAWLLSKANKKKDYQMISNLLKVIMFVGIASIMAIS